MLFAYQSLAGVGIICRLYLADIRDSLHNMMAGWFSNGRAASMPQYGLPMRGLIPAWWLGPEITPRSVQETPVGAAGLLMT